MLGTIYQIQDFFPTMFPIMAYEAQQASAPKGHPLWAVEDRSENQAWREPSPADEGHDPGDIDQPDSLFP